MGKKKTEEKPEEKVEIAKEEAEVNDPLAVKKLKEIDNNYLIMKREMDKEIELIKKRYESKLEVFHEERRTVLGSMEYAETTEKDSATPALPGFYFTALKRLPMTSNEIEDWDEEVLEYCRDITASDLDEADPNLGFKVEFHFVENPYFSNSVVWVEVHTKEKNVWNGEMQCTKMVSSSIDWKPGKNVTVEVVAKKVKGGGAKKAKQKGKVSEEPRDSFFRSIFRNLKLGDPIPDDVNFEGMGIDDEEDEESMVEDLLDNQFQVLEGVKEYLIPFAVRVYTGEAFPDEDDDDDDEDEEEEDDDDDTDEEDESPPAKPKRGGKLTAKGAGGPKEKEECKQQ